MPILIERDVACEMRDGCVLRANLFRPSDEGRYPALVFRTPYDKNAAGNMALAFDPMRMAEAGYVVVQQDVRGRFASEGDFDPFLNDFEDGYDTVEWAAKQPWCDGRVGAYGVSYHGHTAWAAAAAAPPSLKAIAPTQAPNGHRDVSWPGGAFALGSFVHWQLRLMTPAQLLRTPMAPADKMRALRAFVDRLDDYRGMLATAPLRSLPFAQRDTAYFPYAYEILEHAEPGPYHEARSLKHRHGSVETPALITAGWYDALLAADLQHYHSIRTEGATREAREDSRLLIGPWTHGPGIHMTGAGEIDFGMRSSGMVMDLREDFTTYHRRWFDHWLKGAPELGFAPVRIFVMGENRWRDEQEWPLARQVPTPWRLQPDGGFGPAAQPADAPPRAYPHDPDDPCPTLGGPTVLSPIHPKGSVAQNILFERPDVLTFTSEPLAEPLEVTGYVTASIWASTTARDADWVVKLCDVHPDGRSYNICDGVVRASRRDPEWTAPLPLEPGEVVRYEISLLATSMVFKAGHRLQLIVSSSDFPRYDRNPGTGELSLDAVRFESATHRIYCDAERPSHVTLPVIPRL